ncbi:F-box and WD40 domain protein [Penicillium brasilianum]|uniref:Probable E3 ubiquitin ligase complex SCF subunit sconB n=1 Tax=Penicillium brasilianum TaxID=104259 RepID=A0A1S9RQW2_PENBI|nr:F-box and WD40 domain protein [Penicillium brasilianum]
MSPRDNTVGITSRRRPQPGTAAYPIALPKDYTCDQWQKISLVEARDDDASAIEEMEPFPEAVPRRRAAKSFSSLRHPMDGLVALGRRLSVTLRNKSSKQNLRVPGEEQNDESRHYYHAPNHSSHKRNAASGSWGMRSRAWSHGPNSGSINRRPSLNSVSALHGFYVPTASIPSPIPGHGFEPPVLPNDIYAGAAARAAAAAQNEQMELARLETAKKERDFINNLSDLTLTQDSESGIGIDLRDPSEICNTELDIIRIDPVSYLPSEVMTHVLSYLDPASLMEAESVSHSWHRQASSPHVWKHAFRGAYPRRPASATATKKKQSVGLGKSIPNQEWKRMFFVRRALEQRWKEGKAAAIYLHGHQDSVYCAQFDEDKIITGSRDRTIRVWDAHYPWSCRKIIGPPPDDVSIAGPVNNPAQQATGKSPFATICPPSTPSAGIITPMEQPAEYHSASILCLKFDEEIMVTGSSDYTCIVWDVKNDYRPIHRLTAHRAGVLDVCFDDRYIVSCSKDTTICVWDRQTGALLKQLMGHRGPVNAVQLRGDLIVSASGDGVAKLWNVATGHCVKEFPSKDRGLACVEFSDDGRTILTGGNDRTIYQFDANTGELVKELRGHTGLIRSLHLDSMNKRIVSGSYDMSVKVFDTDSGELSIDLPGWTTSWMLNVQSDYRRIVATSQDSRAVIMDFGYGLDGIELLEE